MSRFASSKTARFWAELIAKCERSNASVSQFCQSTGCSPTSYYQWKRKLAAKPQTTAFLCASTSEPTKDSIEIKLPEAGERLEAIGVREQPGAGV
jgi:transposase-like protein